MRLHVIRYLHIILQLLITVPQPTLHLLQLTSQPLILLIITLRNCQLMLNLSQMPHQLLILVLQVTYN